MDSGAAEAQQRTLNGGSSGVVNNTRARQPKPKWRNIVENFSGIWFTLSMNTGILGILMHQLPYQFNGLGVLSSIMYVFNIVLFTVMLLVSLLRWTMFYRTAVRKTAGNIDEISFLGTAPIAFMTLVSSTALNVSNTQWGGHAFTLVAYVMFWVVVAWALLTCMGVCIAIFRTEVCYDRTLSPALFLPVVALATCAVTGGIICTYSYEISPQLQVPVIIVSYFLNGIALWVGLCIYVLFFHRLMAVGWPPGPKLPAISMTVGPMGQIPAALLLLGTAASEGAFAGYHRGTFLTATAGESVAASSTLLALLFLGFDYFWIFVSVWALCEGWYKRELSYSLSWWSTIFPYATTTTSWISLSIAMDSTTFRVLATGLFLILLVDYLINWIFTVYYCIKGDLLVKKEEYIDSEEKQD